MEKSMQPEGQELTPEQRLELAKAKRNRVEVLQSLMQHPGWAAFSGLAQEYLSGIMGAQNDQKRAKAAQDPSNEEYRTDDWLRGGVQNCTMLMQLPALEIANYEQELKRAEHKRERAQQDARQEEKGPKPMGLRQSPIPPSNTEEKVS